MEGIDFNVGADGKIDNSHDRCIPKFYYKAVEMTGESKKQGRPIFKDVAYVEILVPGNARDVVNRKVREEDKERWPRQWLLFSKMGETATEGTPIDELPGLLASQVAVLKSVNIPTIEALAGVSDAHLSGIGSDARKLRDRAANYIALSKDQAVVQELREENEKLAARVAELEARQESGGLTGSSENTAATVTGTPTAIKPAATGKKPRKKRKTKKAD